jgi:hypothetical protein
MGLINLLADLSQFKYYTGKGYLGNGDSPGLDTTDPVIPIYKNPINIPLIDLLADKSKFVYYTSEGYSSDGSTPGMKSLKYGNDQLGGGNSGQPYIKTPIPNGFNNLQLSSSDFILRGGILAPLDAAKDISRLTKMFIDTKSPNGLFFIAKQNLLSRTAVRTQTSGILNEGIYTPLSTLAEAGLVGVGGHVLKQGLNPFAGSGAYSNNPNLYGVKVKNNQSIENNRLVRLYQAQQVNLSSDPLFSRGVTLNKGSINVLSYTGGPGSILGIGNTNIRYADGQQTGKANYKYDSSWFNGQAAWTPSYNWTKDSPSSTYSILKGASGIYVKQTGLDELQNNVYYIGGKLSITKTKTWGPSFAYNVYRSGSLTPFDPVAYNPEYYTPPQQEELVNLRKDSTVNDGKNVYQPLTSGSVLPTEYVNSLDSENSLLKDRTPQPGTTATQQFPQNAFTFDQQNITKYRNSIGNVGPINGSPQIGDFRKWIENQILQSSPQKKEAKESGATPDVPNYYEKNLERRVNIGGKNSGPGQKQGKNLTSYTEGSDIGPVDKINAYPLYQSESGPSYGVKNDLVKFRIAVINNQEPTSKTFMHFRAFIDTFSDTYNASWSPIKYLGRGENFYTYSDFTRTVSLGWTVAAQSKEELIPMYHKLNYLASSLTPDYTPKGYMAGNLVQLTVGGYLYEQVGFFTSLTYDISESTWEIGINDAGDSDPTVKELPHMIKVTSTFTPIHDFVPSLQSNSYTGKDGTISEFGSQRYIALDDGLNNNNYKSKDIKLIPNNP